MSELRLDRMLSVSLRSGVALLPLVLVAAFTPAYAQNQPVSSSSAPADAADAESKRASEQETKIVGAPVDPTDKDKDEESVVVTGTSIRNAPPTGTNLISVDKEGIKATGANSAAELLASIPQAGGNFFNDLAQLGTQDTGGVSSSDASNGGVNKPDVRGIPLNTQLDTGSNTLLLLDGARMAGVGTSNNVSDPNSVPVALLERVEVNTDGGSSIYGSDAIGGVINFVTRRRYDGIQVRGRYGIGDSYDNYEVGAIVGHNFGPANVYLSYSRTGNSGILNGERDYYKSIEWDPASPYFGRETNNQCPLPNVQIGANFFGVDANGNISPTASPIAPNVCTPGKETSLTGSNKRNNVLGSFSYDFSEDLKLTVRGRYSDSSTHLQGAPFGRRLTVMPTDAAYVPIPGQPLVNQTVLLNYGPFSGPTNTFRDFEQWGVSPELTWNIDENWQVRAFVNKEWSRTDNFGDNQIDSTANIERDALFSGALNPYNILDSDLAVLEDITNDIVQSHAKSELLNARVTIDGSLLELPGGKVRVAFGAEYLEDKFALRGNGTFRSEPGVDLDVVTPFRHAKRDSKSLFAELNVPVVSSLNSGPLFEELRFAFSGRYDKYSNFGDNFSPRVGATYSPFKFLRLRGNWGKSFRAPTVIEILAGQSLPAVTVFDYPTVAGTAIFETIFVGNLALPADTASLVFPLKQGAATDLGPQKGTNWSVAAEVRPIQGLRAELSYYKISINDAISTPNPLAFTRGIYPPSIFLLNPTQAEIDAFIEGTSDPDATRADIAGQTVFALYDLRSTNLQSLKVEGLDYSARYDFNTPIGAAYIGVNGNVSLTSKTAVGTSPFINTQGAAPNHRGSVTAGLRSGGFRTQFQLFHTDGYKVVRTANLPQDSVDAFDVLNAFFAYEFTDGELGLGSIAQGLEVTLNINNIFDTDPPEYRLRGGVGYTNGGTLGRVFQLGIRKDF